jgi:hypothetical protein
MALRREVTVTAPAVASSANPADQGQAYDLVDLATAKDELRIKSTDRDHDTYLRRTITQVSIGIADHCKRVFPIEGLFEVLYLDQGPGLSPGQVAPLPLSRWPIANFVVLQASAEADSGNVLTFTAGAIPAQLAAGVPVSHRAVPVGTTVSNFDLTGSALSVTLSQALSTTTPALATQVLVGDHVAFGISVARLILVPAMPATNPPLPVPPGVLQALGPDLDFVIDAPNGRLIRLDPYTLQARAWGTNPTTVFYSAGYAPVPAPVQTAALIWLTSRFHSRGRDPQLRSESEPGAIGARTWWVGGPKPSGAVPEEIIGMLEPYRVPSAG